MLLRAIFLIYILSLITVTMLSTTLLIGKIVLFERALGYVPVGYQSALSTLQTMYATSGGAYIAQQPGVLACVSNDTPCSFYASETITLPPQIAPAAGVACGGEALANCAANLQEDAHVSEGRTGLQISITIADRNKSPIVTRTKYLTLRVFSGAPYFAVIGERDGAFGDHGVSAQGESAGLPAAAGQDDTQIKVDYHNKPANTDSTAQNKWETRGWASGNTSSASWSP